MCCVGGFVRPLLRCDRWSWAKCWSRWRDLHKNIHNVKHAVPDRDVECWCMCVCVHYGKICRACSRLRQTNAAWGIGCNHLIFDLIVRWMELVEEDTPGTHLAVKTLPLWDECLWACRKRKQAPNGVLWGLCWWDSDDPRTSCSYLMPLLRACCWPPHCEGVNGGWF